MLLLMLSAISACQPKVLKGLVEEERQDWGALEGMLVFDEEGKAQYRVKIEAFDQKISGQLIIKKEEQSYRTVIITDFGLKVIDLILFENGEYQVEHIMKHMDYDFVKESFALNILMLLPNPHSDAFTYFINEDLLYIQYPPLNFIYYQKEANIAKVERYRGRKKVWATAVEDEHHLIEVRQTNPSIYMSLKAID